jgi:hypothetical protein
MHLYMTLFVAVLFFVLTPGILVTLPPKGSKVMVALVHALVFALIYSLTHKMVYRFLYEGFESPKCTEAKASGDAAKIAAACTSNTTGVGQTKR